MQYTRLLLLHVAFVLEWYVRPVTLEVIIPVLLSLGQYRHGYSTYIRFNLLFGYCWADQDVSEVLWSAETYLKWER